MEASEKIRIYDKGVDRPGVVSYSEALTVRSGDITIPKISLQEPLRIECQHFVDCVRERQRPLTDGASGPRWCASWRPPRHRSRRGYAGSRPAADGGGAMSATQPATAVVHPTAVLGADVSLGEGCVVGPQVRLGAGCQIGHHVVIHADTVVGDRVRIDDHATLGKRPMRAANSATTREQELPGLIGRRAVDRRHRSGALPRRRHRREGADGRPLHGA